MNNDIKTIASTKIKDAGAEVRVNKQAKHNITISKENNMLYIDFKQEIPKEEIIKTLELVLKTY